MFVVATAGHVDHGKTTLVAALTGMQPDRWAEERRRGLTIDLGFAWTTMSSGRRVAFVDVPGHERFLGNTLAGLGPAPVVCFVVAADQGWQEQSGEHRDAVAALGISHGLIVLTRTDRASAERIDEVLVAARAELAPTGLRDAPAVAVSAVDGTGLAELRSTLDDVLADLPAPTTTGRVRLWVDRSFTITGAGTVVTGTLTAGTLRRGERLQLCGHAGSTAVVVRGLQSCDEPHSAVSPVARVAVNLRGIGADEVRRGDALLTPDSWLGTRIVDVRRTGGAPYTELPEQLTVHVGTAAVPGRLRSFDVDHARLALNQPLPLTLSDRLILRHPGGRRMLCGAEVLDADPPPLRRRGDAARRAGVLTGLGPAGDLLVEVARRGAVTVNRLRMLGYPCALPPAGVRVIGEKWVSASAYDSWQQRLTAALGELHDRDPLAAGLSRGAACDLLDLPDEALLDSLIRDAGLECDAGRIRLPGSRNDLGRAAAAVTELEARLAADPFHAPEADELAVLHLGVRELAAAERAGRLLRLTDTVVVLPSAPALAMRELARLDQPFTASQARQALGTTRRVAIPLLEHLDAGGWTRRIDASYREVAR
ncbi:MAG: selenocysteine-specific translation elongation factor [Mycobacterium sp.]